MISESSRTRIRMNSMRVGRCGQDLLNGTKNDSSQVKRIVLACERDMEDFTVPWLEYDIQ